jgi:radical SAM superfamily enzyme YgiQ (UPF0313 family)
MAETRVLLVFPGSLYGGRWADGPRVKPELVQLFTELRRAGFESDVLDLEAELGNPADDVARESFLQIADGLLAEYEADLVVISCWSALQYSAAVAVAERVRRRLPEAVIAACGHHVSVRPDDFNDPGAPFDWLIAGEAESAVVTLAGQVSAGDRETGACHSLEGTPLPLDAAHLPDYAAYPYAAEGLPELGLFLSRGCPYNAPACLLRPGGAGWHAYPPETAVAAIAAVAALRPARVMVLDPAFGYEAGWRRAVLDLLAAGDRRDLALSISGRADVLTRLDVDKVYRARLGLVLEVGTLSQELLAQTGQAPNPQKAVAHALELVEYLNAKGVVTRARFTFNQPGETEETAAETLAALERFVTAAPNTSVTLDAQTWAFTPASEDEADVVAPAARFGTRIAHPEWWKERGDAYAAATAVVASRELAARPPGDESYWRPRFDELREALAAKLTADARRGLRSHEAVGSEAYGVPHGWWTEPRWH